ncbi:MAG: DUF3822 family protein [Bacteroidota bacterium]
MGVLKTTINDELFNQRKAHQYQLSILLGIDSLLYLVYTQEARILLLKEYTFKSINSQNATALADILSFIGNDRLLKLAYREIKIAYLSQKRTFVPNRLYHPDQKKIYLEHIVGLEANDTIQSDDLSLLRSQNIYAVNSAALHQLQQLFPRSKQYHITSALYLGYRNCCTLNKANLFVNLRDQSIQIFLFQGQELLFANIMPVHAVEDLVYYVMMVFRQFNLSADQQIVQVSGDIREGADYHRALSRYVKYIQATPSALDYTYHEMHRNTLGKHHFFDVMSIALCS